MKKTVVSQRSHLAALKRRVLALQRALIVAAQAATSSKPSAKVDAKEEDGGPLRFRAAEMAANRKSFGLSAAELGLLVKATGQSVYASKAGEPKP